MLTHAPSKDPFVHIRGIWGYLRLGIAICAAFFAVGGLVSLARNGYGPIMGIVAGVVILGVALAAAVPKMTMHSRSERAPPALAELILMFSISAELSQEILGDLAEHFAGLSAQTGPTAARVWYWTQVARYIPRVRFGAVLRVVAEAMAGVTAIMHLFMR
jgi:hypothetical protein